MEQAMNAFLQLVLEEAVRVLTPFVLAALIGLIGYGIKWLRENIGERRWKALTIALEYAIFAAEQAGLSDAIANEGQAKKELAIALAEEFLAERGIKIDVERLSALIEAELGRTINYFKVFPSQRLHVDPADGDSAE